MKQLHIKNHFVPQLYLKNWAKDDRKIDIYKTLVPHKDTKTWVAKSPSAIAWQRHLYTQIVLGEENDDFEEWFGREFESPAEPIIKKVIMGSKLKPSDWKILIRFLASQDLRTPASLLGYLNIDNEKIFGDLLQKNLDETSKHMMSKNFYDQVMSDKSDTDEVLDELPLKLSFYHDKKNKKMRVNAKSYIGRKSWLFLVKGTLEKCLDKLLRQKWSIIQPAKGYNFLTSDNPVVKLKYYKDRSYKLVNAGIWEQPNTTIILPLSPSHAMITEIGSNVRFIKGTRLSTELTKELCGFIAENSHRHIFSKGIDPTIEDLKPRVVDEELFSREQEQLKNWHEMNKELETDYEKTT